MDGYSISQTAERTGFPASTLRFYEDAGLVDPLRTPAGYRCYDDGMVERLRFIGRAKGFGLTLDEIAELLTLLDDERCAPVQRRLRGLVSEKITDAQATIAELIGFTAELQRVSAVLEATTPDGPCDDTCGCTADDGSASPPRENTMGALTERPTGSGHPIACSLPPEQTQGRMAAWQALLSGHRGREGIDGGIRVSFPGGVDVGTLAALCAAEQTCCNFFTFALTIEADGVTLDITGPDEAAEVIEAFVGPAA